MRKIVLAAAMAGSALSLTACSDAENTADTAAEDTVGGTVPATDGVEDTTAGVGTVLNANTATAEELAGAEGVSPALAAAIIAGKPYGTVADLNAVLGETLSQEEATAVLANIFVPVNLNSATEEEIKLIPGMTDRMVGEFLEYRPYEDMNEFDREIGKYVDQAEVARFRNYVTL